ncbi:putative arabinose efflux permease, MFS family [Streptoalloteichus tenebrarius]|uniref:Arabinose efflux permease, MFS family n=1 Tax=Streptoalloteichus tenebrarius (strain ATCC 17920 / DSM 40477 / JCM 4838 / CBS 697.72 / NBRC 16177 / NCIMB 11028 / NRRL B-12390 / A12253. 1 / ISP 5477) TaxID=1933 RepID=A0ABT1HZR6_STRSD|nr:MFS transporter [Streptoalloteichus tenebrarius]MCP2260996.1 putative arabinose efflux permease, MFS family [Streptoalloteichus tenebrarius]BFE98935.1 MFS transporter [Streptoalloteichus tenebrarius]
MIRVASDAPASGPPAPAPCRLRAAPVRATGHPASFVLTASILVALLAASGAPTPLYPLYQDHMGLSALDVTVVFSAYSLALLLALLTTGALSDHLGRRPVLVGALVVEAAAMLLLASADGGGPLIAARVLQGMATGVATSAAGAALLDREDPRRPGRSALTNSIAPVAGMAAGVLAATLLVRFAPAPAVTVFVLLAVVFVAQAIAISFTTETAHRRPGALRSLRPRLSVPPTTRRALSVVGTGVVAIWALSGFYSSLGPALVRLVAPHAPQAAGGMIFFVLSATATLAVWMLRRTAPRAMVIGGCLSVLPAAILMLVGLHGGGLPTLYCGAALAGVAFGAVSQGALRMILPSRDEQGGAATVASYYVLSYLSMSLPAIAAGAATQHYGLGTTSHACAVAAALLSVAALAVLAATRRGR